VDCITDTSAAPPDADAIALRLSYHAATAVRATPYLRVRTRHVGLIPSQNRTQSSLLQDKDEFILANHRVNSNCAHQVRPPLQSSRPLSSLGIPPLPAARHRDALTFYIWLFQHM
jgi:hypothetical protein